MFDDGSSEDITSQAEFSIEGGAAATVTPAGLARAVAEGTSTVTAKLGQISGNATAQVVAASSDELAFGIGDFQLAQLQRARLHVFTVLGGTTMQDSTAAASYHTDNPAVAAATAPGQIDGGAQAGTATISVCLGGAKEGTVKVTVAAKQCRPVINEFQTGGSASAADEWVEILNPCTAAVDVTGWTLVYRGSTVVGGTDSTLMATLAGELAPGEIRLYAGVGFAGTSDGTWPGATGLMGQTNGAVALRMGPKDMGPIADAVAYGAVTGGHPFIEGAALGPMTNDLPAQRLPFDGRDDDNGAADFVQVQTGSPRAPNAP
jgi:hypothetical protein